MSNKQLEKLANDYCIAMGEDYHELMYQIEHPEERSELYKDFYWFVEEEYEEM